MKPHELIELQVRTAAAVFERIKDTTPALGDTIFVDTVVAECLGSLSDRRSPDFTDLPSRSVSPMLLQAIVGEIRAVAGSGTQAECDAIERAVYVETIEQRSKTASERGVIDAVLERHLALVVRRDRATGQHSRAVAQWCRRISEQLGLSSAEIAFAGRCGLIHDIGKSLTPLEVLRAPRPLSGAEASIMRKHVFDGYRLIAEDPILAPFAAAARSHHERFDGDGYPDGLRGSRIPLAVRIVTVADAFNAMITRRSALPPFSPDRALEELANNRGTQFDPEIVDAMISVVTVPLGEIAS